MAREEESKFVKKSDYRRSRFETGINRSTRPGTVRQLSSRERRRREIVQRSREPLQVQGGAVSTDNLSFVKTDNTNTLYTLTTLNPGQNLKEVLISHWNSGSNDAVVSMYWSISGPNDVSATVAAGRITSQQSGNFIRIFTMTVPHASVISLDDSGITTNFTNFSKPIFFYVISSQQYTQFTVIKS
tara:strand:- start:385 stop:942 length:558 start_codon:yes stop_codon:yes gene_type:complete